MTFYETVMLWFSFIGTVLYYIAGGWTKVRDYFKAKAQKKADAIEAEVQARLKAAQAEIKAAPESTATSVDGPVTDAAAA
ncbi:DUF1378 family protein [Pantoea sp.]|uniref:DUF1378 family protein n=1 Tax=Pantoea sp. TaxID=69393 RepID=UPI0028A63C55|nr:DUF1378 family protein [Pantoea sp.]